MPEPVQAKMSRAFGTDLSAVRIHEGPQAPALGARAYTQGTNVHFAPGEYQPDSQSGQELLGHELAHVVQQSTGRVSATTQLKGVGMNDDGALEREADEMGARAARGEAAHSGADAPSVHASHGVVQRLQMIGENHAESDMRKDAEKEFCSTKFGNGFYEENEYTLHNQPGDPKEMGAIRFLIGVVFGTHILIDSTGDDSSQWEERDWDLTTEIIESVQLDVRDTLSELAELRSGNVRLAYKNYAQLAVASRARLEELRDALASMRQHAESKDSKSFETSKDPLETAWDGLKQVVAYDPGNEEGSLELVKKKYLAQVDGKRDVAMAEALYFSKNVPGVWKVGQAHIAGVYEAIEKYAPGWTVQNNKIIDEDLFTQFFHIWYKSKSPEAYALYMEQLKKYRSEDI